MSPARYLTDTSALTRLLRSPDIRAAWQEQIAAGLVSTCPVVELELLYSARSAANRDALVAGLHIAFGRVPMPDRVFERAAEIQAWLTDRGTHRSAGVADLLVAATAELHRLTLLHYDADFVKVAEVTGQPVRWLAEPGSVA